MTTKSDRLNGIVRRMTNASCQWKGRTLIKNELFGVDRQGPFVSRGRLEPGRVGAYVQRTDESANFYRWHEEFDTGTTGMSIWLYRKVKFSKSGEVLFLVDEEGTEWKYKGERGRYAITAYMKIELDFDFYWKKIELNRKDPIAQAFAMAERYGIWGYVEHSENKMYDCRGVAPTVQLAAKPFDGMPKIRNKAMVFDRTSSVVALSRQNTNIVIYKYEER